MGWASLASWGLLGKNLLWRFSADPPSTPSFAWEKKRYSYVVVLVIVSKTVESRRALLFSEINGTF